MLSFPTPSSGDLASLVEATNPLPATPAIAFGSGRHACLTILFSLIQLGRRVDTRIYCRTFIARILCPYFRVTILPASLSVQRSRTPRGSQRSQHSYH
jgi:hypothetical protein